MKFMTIKRTHLELSAMSMNKCGQYDDVSLKYGSFNGPKALNHKELTC